VGGVGRFPGRQRWRSVDSSLRRFAVFSTQGGSPKGLPRTTERCTALHSASVATASTCAAQFRGKAIMTPDPPFPVPFPVLITTALPTAVIALRRAHSSLAITRAVNCTSSSGPRTQLGSLSRPRVKCLL
jgi:hypothetical protein